jgi:sugar O-acyltransferase (sialic acid O-acetyltransferase NeuD family)
VTGKRVAVYGAGGHGKVVADIAMAAGQNVVAFIDDSPSKKGATIWEVPVISWQRFADEVAARHGASVGLGIGDNAARERCVTRLRSAGIAIATLVHPSATVARSAVVGEGSVIMAGAVVNPDADVGTGCIINTGAVVEHDCVVAPFAHLSPNAALGGGVHVGRRTHLGLGAVVLPLVRIGDDVRVGAGAVVRRDVASGLTVVGVPARPLRATIDDSDIETRAAILKEMAATESIQMPDDVIRFLAKHMQANARDLEGTVMRVAAHALQKGEPITVPLARDVLAEVIPQENG